jgi:hypothetical protein
LRRKRQVETDGDSLRHMRFLEFVEFVGFVEFMEFIESVEVDVCQAMCPLAAK